VKCPIIGESLCDAFWCEVVSLAAFFGLPRHGDGLFTQPIGLFLTCIKTMVSSPLTTLFEDLLLTPLLRFTCRPFCDASAIPFGAAAVRCFFFFLRTPSWLRPFCAVYFSSNGLLFFFSCIVSLAKYARGPPDRPGDNLSGCSRAPQISKTVTYSGRFHISLSLGRTGKSDCRYPLMKFL